MLVSRAIAPQFIEALRKVAAGLSFGNPEDPAVFAGPLATEAAREKLERSIQCARDAGAEPLVPGQRLPGGFYRTASLHLLRDAQQHIPGYTDTEVFGPDLSIAVIDSDDEAIALLKSSPYGFANAVFTGSDARFDRIYAETRPAS